MSNYEKVTYYLILKKRGKKQYIIYSIGNISHEAATIRVGGKNVDKIFKDIIAVLSSQGGLKPISIADNEKIYGIREDLGPVVGAYLILVYRSRRIEKWSEFLRALFEERYPGLVRTLVLFLEVALELSRSYSRVVDLSKKKKDYALPSAVLNVSSATLKVFVSKIVTKYKYR